MSGLESQLPALLLFLSGASVLAVVTQRWLRAPYTVALAGLLVQVVSLPWLIRALDIGERAAPAGEFEWAEAE